MWRHDKVGQVTHWKLCQLRTCSVIDVACPFDTRVLEKEQEKMEKNQDLKEKSGRSGTVKE